MTVPVDIKVKQKDRILAITYEDGRHQLLDFKTVRRNSPSAENRNQAAENCEEVMIVGIEPVGNYGIKIAFDDGHDTGIYRFDFLASLSIPSH